MRTGKAGFNNNPKKTLGAISVVSIIPKIIGLQAYSIVKGCNLLFP